MRAATGASASPSPAWLRDMGRDRRRASDVPRYPGGAPRRRPSMPTATRHSAGGCRAARCLRGSGPPVRRARCSSRRRRYLAVRAIAVAPTMPTCMRCTASALISRRDGSGTLRSTIFPRPSASTPTTSAAFERRMRLGAGVVAVRGIPTIRKLLATRGVTSRASALPALLGKVSGRNVDRYAYPEDLLSAVHRRRQQDRPSVKLGDQRAQRKPHPAVDRADAHGFEEFGTGALRPG